MARGTFTISAVSGAGPYVLTVSSAAGIVADDHVGARITSTSGPGGLWVVTGVAGNDVTVADTLTEENGGAFGAPIAGSYLAWFGTPTTRGLSRPPHLGVAWDASQRRNAFLLKGMAVQEANAVAITGGTITGITDLAVADGGTGASDASGARTNLGLGTIATQAANNVAITGGAITGITDLAVADGGTGASDASGARTNLGLGTIATQAANNVAITGGSVTGITDLAVADGGTGASDAAGARTNLGAQALDAELTAIAGLTSAADKVPYFTGSGSAALADFSSFGRSIVDDANASAARTTLGVAIGSDVQAYDAQLASLAALSYSGNADKVIAVKGAEDGFELQTVATLENLGFYDVQDGTGSSETSTITAGTLATDGDALRINAAKSGSTGTLSMTVAGVTVFSETNLTDAYAEVMVVRTSSSTARASYFIVHQDGDGVPYVDGSVSITGADWSTAEDVVLTASAGEANALVVEQIGPSGGSGGGSGGGGGGLLSLQRQTSGATLSYSVPAGELSTTKHVLEVDLQTFTGTSGSVTITISFGGVTIFTQASITANQRVTWKIRIGYLTDTTFWVSHTRIAQSSAAGDQSETLTISSGSFSAGATFTSTMTGGTNPCSRVLEVSKLSYPA